MKKILKGMPLLLPLLLMLLSSCAALTQEKAPAITVGTPLYELDAHDVVVSKSTFGEGDLDYKVLPSDVKEYDKKVIIYSRKPDDRPNAPKYYFKAAEVIKPAADPSQPEAPKEPKVNPPFSLYIAWIIAPIAAILTVMILTLLGRFVDVPDEILNPQVRGMEIEKISYKTRVKPALNGLSLFSRFFAFGGALKEVRTQSREAVLAALREIPAEKAMTDAQAAISNVKIAFPAETGLEFVKVMDVQLDFKAVLEEIANAVMLIDTFGDQIARLAKKFTWNEKDAAGFVLDWIRANRGVLGIGGTITTDTISAAVEALKATPFLGDK
jgi:hypothetical protein